MKFEKKKKKKSIADFWYDETLSLSANTLFKSSSGLGIKTSSR
jgi:hypothetical protein